MFTRDLMHVILSDLGYNYMTFTWLWYPPYVQSEQILQNSHIFRPTLWGIIFRLFTCRYILKLQHYVFQISIVFLRKYVSISNIGYIYIVLIQHQDFLIRHCCMFVLETIRIVQSLGRLMKLISVALIIYLWQNIIHIFLHYSTFLCYSRV